MKLSNGKTLSVSTQRLKMYIAGHRHGLLPARSIFYHNYMRRQLAETLAPPIFFPRCDSLSHLKCHLRCTCMLATGYNIDLPRCLRNENYIHIAYSIIYMVPAINKNNKKNNQKINSCSVPIVLTYADLGRFGDFPQVHLESRSCCSQQSWHIIATTVAVLSQPSWQLLETPLHTEQQHNETQYIYIYVRVPISGYMYI